MAFGSQKYSGPCADLVEFNDCGHAHALLDRHQIGVVADWLATA